MTALRANTRMKRAAMMFAAVVVVLVQACTSKAQDAEEQYNIVSKSGSLGDKCEKARQVKNAYLAAHDQENYKRWKLSSDIDCLRAEQEGADLPANDKERTAIENQAAADASNAAEAALTAAQTELSASRAAAATADDDRPIADNYVYDTNNDAGE